MLGFACKVWWGRFPGDVVGLAVPDAVLCWVFHLSPHGEEDMRVPWSLAAAHGRGRPRRESHIHSEKCFICGVAHSGHCSWVWSAAGVPLWPAQTWQVLAALLQYAVA